ncbi:DUF6838 family protein [Psychrobacillus sp. NPDC093180]|uniref:phage tail terminator family protein n=1 Tax=Psychrobacillus sp. NPDC093180 TaxID=3364489 RepID=UPI0037FD1112
MITYIDIKKTLNTRIKKKFNIEVISKDVTEGFNRPSFFIGIENPIRSGDENQVHKSMTIQIYYFPTDRYEYALEIMDVQEQLENLFDLKLKVKDRYFNIDEARANTTDGVLSFAFDIEFYDGREYDGLENIFVNEEIIGNESYEKETGRDFYEDHPIEKMEFLDIEEE